MENSPKKRINRKFLFLYATFFAWMFVTTIWYFNYPFPNGQGTLFGFLGIFLREIIILGLILASLIYLAIDKFIQKPKAD
jgi:hypothetical protein